MDFNCTLRIQHGNCVFSFKCPVSPAKQVIQTPLKKREKNIDKGKQKFG